jgi:L-ascorbate metabolism protein UlaG (beta-lactamase superfamily)
VRALLASVLLVMALAACTPVNIHYNATKAHHRPHGFVNSDPAAAVGGFPWYEILFRNLRGDFRPVAPPEDGYEAFAAKWTTPVDHALLARRTQEPRITWLGHASLLLQVGGQNILIDPQLSAKAGPVIGGLIDLGAPRLVSPPLTEAQLPPIDLVLISHNHYDHLDEATLRRLHAAGQKPAYVVPLGLKSWFEEQGLGPVAAELDWWDSTEIAGLTLFFTPAQHWSRRTAFDTNASLWGGFMVEWKGGEGAPWRFLYTGDTGYSGDFREIRRRLGAVDLLAVPVGAYLPRDFMGPQHVNPDDALQILLDLDAKQGVGVHWGTFALTQEPFDQPPKDLESASRQRRLSPERIWLLKHGETRTVRIEK